MKMTKTLALGSSFIATLILSGCNHVSTTETAVKDDSETTILKSIYTNVILKDSGEAKKSCDVFLEDITQKNTQNYRNDFENLVLHWKKVETNYIAPEIDPYMQDTPFYIDSFHYGNEDIPKTITRLLSSNKKPESILYKNSYKSLTALETVLFSKGKWTNRHQEFVKPMVDALCYHIKEIDEFYRDPNNQKKFVTNSNNAIQMMLNRLIGQTFKLKDWRLGEPVGLTKKYLNKPDVNRSEYPLSNLSIKAALAIVEAQDALVGKQDFANFATLLKNRDLSKELDSVDGKIKKVKTSLQDLTSFNAQNIKPIMADLSSLQYDYGTTILKKLPIVGQILEADGD